MLIGELLDRETVRRLNLLKQASEEKEARPRDKPRKESFTNRELEYLMGQHRDIYVRKNGAVRRR